MLVLASAWMMKLRVADRDRPATPGQRNETPAERDLRWPGPPIVLNKGQPTSIWVINDAPEPTQVHWHGRRIAVLDRTNDVL